MANACFRCRKSIPSGGTFCSRCQSAVSLDEARAGDSPGWWKGVAVGTVGMVLYAVVAIGGDAVGFALPPLVTGLVVAVVMMAHFAGLYLDARALGGRPDLDWTPSDTWLSILLFLSLFVLTIPLVGCYYLFRRRQHVGLDG